MSTKAFPYLIPLLLLWTGCPAPADDDSAPDDDSAADDDTAGDDDSDPEGSFIHATGTFDGTPFALACDDTTTSNQLVGAVYGTAVNLICHDYTNWYEMTLAMVGGGVGSFTVCADANYAKVFYLNTGASVDCRFSPPTSYELDVTSYVGNADGSVAWEGTFQMAADDGVHSAEVTGSFRGISSP